MGSDYSSWSSVIGPHGIGECNENGERLLDFCDRNQTASYVYVVSTQVTTSSYTWFRYGDCTRPGHMIDYVLFSKRFRTSGLDTHVYRSTLHESDNELVVSSFRFKIKTKQRHSRSPRYQTINVPSSNQFSYQSTLAESFDTADNCCSSSLTTLWETFKSSVQKPCEAL